MIGKTRFTLFFVLLFGSGFGFCQTIVSGTGERVEFPRERVFVHYNSSLLLTGEYLYYSAYCLHPDTAELSTLSKIAYVELVSSEGETVFRHKLRLENGRGQGDFFIPTSVPSGNYKLFGYTRLMRNGRQNDFFQGNLTIINPYTNDQNALRAVPTDSTKVLPSKLPKPVIPASSSEKYIDMILNKSRFGKRERVVLSFGNLEESVRNGNYSLSVRKLDRLKIPQAFTSKDFITQIKDKRQGGASTAILILPELRGELLTGRIIAKNADVPVNRVRIAISVPGKNYKFKVVTTNVGGNFYFVLHDNYDGEEAVLQVLDNSEKFEIKITEPAPLDISGIHFDQFILNEEMESVILERSVHNQIENNYFSLKPDSVKLQPRAVPFYGNMARQYVLDEYTRFPTIEETIVEILEGVWTKRSGNGDKSIQVRSEAPSNEQLGFPALVLVDGLFVQDHNDLMRFDARKVESVNVVMEEYILGSQIFQGVVDITTLDGDYWDNFQDTSALRYRLFKPLPRKYYFNQKYDGESSGDLKRIPDYRHQLFWNPDLEIQAEPSEIEFYTSDVTGDFEISLEGFTGNGRPVSIRKGFTVE